MDVPLHGPIVSPVLVGRDPHIEALDHLILQACRGGGQTVLIGGEAGIGKSRLIAEARIRFVARVAVCGVGSGRVLQGHCFEADRAHPYAPLRDLLRALVATGSPEQTAALVDLSGPDLAKLLPELSAAMPANPAPPPFDPADERRRLFEALTRLFLGLSAGGPLLIVVEDLHWSDDLSLDFLLHLARRIGDRAILLLISYRSEDVHPSLRHTLAELDRGRLASELVLSPLTYDEVDRMLRAIFGQWRPVRLDFLQAVYALTEGNPFFIEEVLSALSMAGDAFQTGGWARADFSKLRIPRSVHDAVQRRAGQLSSTAQRVLAMAAVAGRRFDFAVLREVTGQDEAELLRSIKELVAAQLVVEESGDQFAFRHALTRQAVYQESLAIERKALHRSVAEAMQRVLADTPDMHAGDLAYHYHEAGVWQTAFDYARRAGEQAMALYAPQAAVVHFTRALDAAGHLSGTPPGDVYRARGRAFEILGDFERAREDLERSLELARAGGDERAEWQVMLDLGMLWASRDYARAGECDRSALDLARAIDNPATIGRSLNRLGNWYVNVERPLEGLRHHEEALAIFEELGDRAGIAETLDLLGMARCCGGDLRGSMARYERAAALFRERDDRAGLVMSLALLSARAGEYHFDPLIPDPSELARAVAAGEEAVAIAREIHWRSGEAFAGGQFALCLGTWGEYGRALPIAHGAAWIASEIEHRQWQAFTNQVLGWLYHDLLALPTARHHFEQSLHLARQANSFIWSYTVSGALASTYVHQGDLAQAETILATVPGPEELAHTFGQWVVFRAHVELALARRDPERALDLLEELVASLMPAGGEGQRPIGPPHLGRLRGEALAALGRVTEAEAVLQVDLTAARERNCLPLQWRLHAALGHVYRADRQRSAADREFAAARAIINELAANVPDQEVRDTFRLKALTMLPSLRPPTTLRVARHAFGGLTRREREVAALIARNKSNREISQALFVGERTVATHVSHILAKLNVGSRTEIAAWARERGLTRPR